jgi:Holliday junction resolvasome RuvABC endonuclease subunit
MVFGRVLGISLGTRKVGLAIVNRRRLPFCASKTFQELWSQKKLQKITTLIERYINTYQISFIAIKIPTLAVPAPALTELQTAIEQLATEKGIAVHIYTIADIKKAHGLKIRTNKKEFMQQTVERFPALKDRYEREIKNKISHYNKLFEAAAVADILYQNLRL